MGLPAYYQEFWTDFAEAFIHPLTADGILGKFVTNPSVTGAYAEAHIRSIVASMLPHYRVSTGAIIRTSDRIRNKKEIPQCDLIIWDPTELPALFEKGDFALVSNISARAVIEVKRSTNKKMSDFSEQLKQQQRCLLHEYRTNVLGLVVKHHTTLFTEQVTPSWLKDSKDLWRAEPAKIRLLDSENKPDANGIHALIYFLTQVSSNPAIIG